MIYLVGNGGHASVVADLLSHLDKTFKTIPHHNGVGDSLRGHHFAIGVGDQRARRAVYERLSEIGKVMTLVHPSAVLPAGNYHDYSMGTQIMAGAVIQPYVTMGCNVLINTRASVDHGCHIDDHVHIAPGAILCGDVTVGEGAFVGAGAVGTEGANVPPNSFVKAGSVFTSYSDYQAETGT